MPPATTYQATIQTLNSKTSESGLTKNIAQKVSSEIFGAKKVLSDFDFARNLSKHGMTVTSVFELNKCKTSGISFPQFSAQIVHTYIYNICNIKKAS